MKTIDWKVLYL